MWEPNEQTLWVSMARGLDDRGIGVRAPVGSGTFTSPYRTDRLWGSPSLPSNGYQGLHGVKRQEREAGQSLLNSLEDKKTWIYISTPPYTFTANLPLGSKVTTAGNRGHVLVPHSIQRNVT
jgi:hypothetical protein